MQTVICVGTGLYRVVWPKDRRMIKVCDRLLRGLPVNHCSGRYHYALFCNGSGFVVRRKDASISACEQTWADVCAIELLPYSGPLKGE